MKGLQSLEYNPILFYKPQGIEITSEGEHAFAKDDFAIVIQTKFQRDMMIKLGKSVICCDSTHGINQYSFPLTSVLVIDDFGEGVPVAWPISNHEDGMVISEFFSVLKEKTGDLEPDWFMTDDAPQYFTAWQNEYDVSARTKKILCRWHIDKSWRRALNEKVSDKSDRIDIYHHLMVLMRETSFELFFNVFWTMEVKRGRRLSWIIFSSITVHELINGRHFLVLEQLPIRTCMLKHFIG